MESYRLLRERLPRCPLYAQSMPQLVICGHGSVDDPDARIVYQHTMHIIQTTAYDGLREDISVVRSPPEDRILNALLRCSLLALQLSHREGFEVKVTEAMRMWKPVVIYRTGGMPLQLPTDYAYIVDDVGNTERVCQCMLDLLCDPKEYRRTSEQVHEYSTMTEFYTTFQCVNWLWICRRLLKHDQCQDNQVANNSMSTPHWVKDEWQQLQKVSDQ